MKYIALYNPNADNGNGKENAEVLSIAYCTDEFTYVDITSISDYAEFLSGVPLTTNIVICGGDGTLNRFVNDTKSIFIKHKLCYYPCGSGNDFAKDIGASQKIVPLDGYLQNLPTVTVNGKEYLFINAIGYGIDGYCCEKGDEIRKKNPKKKINYTSIAIKGLLFHFKPVNATITVDGISRTYKKVWLAPAMHGRYYGGGMMAAPNQQRNNSGGETSVMIFHDCGKLKSLCIFPSIFSGKHVEKTKNVTVLTGQNITVRFDEPRALQVDGETILGVTEYEVKNCAVKAQNANAV